MASECIYLELEHYVVLGYSALTVHNEGFVLLYFCHLALKKGKLMQLGLRQQLIGLWRSSFLFVSVTLAETHVGQWPRLHGGVTDGVHPQRKRDKDGEIKTQ